VATTTRPVTKSATKTIARASRDGPRWRTRRSGSVLEMELMDLAPFDGADDAILSDACRMNIVLRWNDYL
jgi:hypothetical protein